MKPLAASAVLVVAAATSLALAQAQKPTAPEAGSTASTPGAARAAASKPAAPAGAKSGSKAQAPSAGAAHGGGVQQCIACHGEQGQGNPQSGIPRIAGQPEAYLRKQLDSYADGSRRNAVMQPIAKALSREARAAGAAYYAGLSPTAAAGANAATTSAGRNATTGVQGANAPAGKPGANAAAGASGRGEELATVGDGPHQVQACGNCHGPGGTGEPPAVPYLAGQDAAYLTAALNEFKNGARRNDAGAQMRTVVRGMTADDIDAVAQYYAARVPPARPAPANIVRAPSEPPMTVGATARGGASTTTQSSAGASGTVGSEQGAGTTGGAQGQGGVDQGSRLDKPAPSKGR